jgi:uncharacterized protein
MDGVDPTARRSRVAGMDLARAVALIGVAVMNYHGYLVIRSDGLDTDTVVQRLFDPWEGPLSTRFATMFVVVAGMGVTMLTNRSRLSGDATARSTDRWRLLRRGLLLYAFGYVFDWFWPGTILFFYGAMFMVAALMFTWPSRALIGVGVAAIAAAGGIQWWAAGRSDLGRSFFTTAPRSLRGLALDTFVNGTHPLLPWLAFLCVGMVLARHLPDDRGLARLGGFALVALVVSYIAAEGAGSSLRAAAMLGTDPYDRSPNYSLNLLASAVAAICAFVWIGRHFPSRAPVRWLITAGQMSLTLYVAHALLFNVIVDKVQLVRPTGLDVALVFAGLFWLLAIAAAVLWRRAWPIGPLEWVYRRFGD